MTLYSHKASVGNGRRFSHAMQWYCSANKYCVTLLKRASDKKKCASSKTTNSAACSIAIQSPMPLFRRNCSFLFSITAFLFSNSSSCSPLWLSSPNNDSRSFSSCSFMLIYHERYSDMAGSQQLQFYSRYLRPFFSGHAHRNGQDLFWSADRNASAAADQSAGRVKAPSHNCCEMALLVRKLASFFASATHLLEKC